MRLSVLEVILTPWVSNLFGKTLQGILPGKIKFQHPRFRRSYWPREPLRVSMSSSILWYQMRKMQSWFPFLSILCTQLLFPSMVDHQLPTIWTKREDGNLIWSNLKDAMQSPENKAKASKLWSLLTLEIQLVPFWAKKPLKKCLNSQSETN